MLITHDLSIGGLQRVVVNLVRCLDREKFDIYVLCLNELGDYASEIEKMGVRVIQLPRQSSGVDYFSFIKVAKIIRNEKIEILHSHNTQALIDAALAGLMVRVKRIVHTDHARSFPDKRRYMVAEWLLSHLVYKFVGVSSHTCKNLNQYEKIPRKKLAMIPNGIEERDIKKHVDKSDKRHTLGVTSEGPLIGLGARLTVQKGIIFLLSAMPSIVERFPTLSLVICGDGPLKEELENRAKSLGVKDHVFFVGARLDMHEILHVLDLYVLPSLWEGLPMVLLEALAAGCPVVATDVGGVNMAIKNNETGLLVPSQNPEYLASAIILMLEDATLRRKCIENGIQLFRQNFSASKMAKRYEKLYLEDLF